MPKAKKEDKKEKAGEKKAEKKPAKGKEKADAKKAAPRSGHIHIKVKEKKAKETPKEEKKPEKAEEKHAVEKRHREKKPGVPEWVELKPQEAVEAIVNLANAGKSGSEIGMLLRDQYGVPNIKTLVGKSVEGILADQKLLPEIPEDLMNLIKKSVNLRRHLGKNKKDFSAKRGLQLTVSKIRRLVKYYKTEGKLPLEWRYSEETAALLVK